MTPSVGDLGTRVLRDIEIAIVDLAEVRESRFLGAPQYNTFDFRRSWRRSRVYLG
jgi:hypothetical protein